MGLATFGCLGPLRVTCMVLLGLVRSTACTLLGTSCSVLCVKPQPDCIQSMSLSQPTLLPFARVVLPLHQVSPVLVTMQSPKNFC